MSFTEKSFPTSLWDGLTGNNWRTSRAQPVNPDHEDWDRLVSEVIALQEAIGVTVAGSGVGAKNGAEVAVVESSNGVVHRSVFTLANLSVTTTDAGAAGSHGNHKLYDFPAGVIQVLGCTSDLTIARVGVAIGATAAIVSAIGTTAAANDNATLTTTEADIIPSTASTLTAGAGVMKGKSTAATMAAGVFDGTSAAKDAYLNFAMPDGDSSATDALLVNGTVTLTWVNHGDN